MLYPKSHSNGLFDAKGQKKMNRKRSVRLGAVALAGLMVISTAGCGSATAQMTEEQVKLRDISTYHSFTGNIAPVSEQNVLPDLSGVKVLTVNVSEGDEVKKGDVLMTLDSDSLQEQIDELEASINASEKSTAASISSAQQTYSNYQQNLNDGLDSSIQNAKNSMDSAYSNLVSAQQKYNDEVELNNQQLSSSILQAKQSVDSSYSNLQSAQSQVESAQLSLNQAKENRQKASNEGITDLTAYDQEIASLEQKLQSAQTSLSNSETLYNDAVNSYEAAKQGEENTLTSLYDALIQAQTSYTSAVDSYNAAVRNSEQQLQTYASQVESAQANSSQQDSNKLKLEDLKEQLEDCNVKAPMDGVVTALNVKAGDLTSSGTAAAVITSFDTMKIDIKINEYDIQGVEEGDPVTITVDALDKEYQGTIKTISRVATTDNGVSYFTAEVNFDADEDARSGMSVEVKLTISEALNTTSVSSSAIQTAEDGSSYVLMYADDKKKETKQQTVTLGITDGTYTQVTEGLYPGDTILYSANTASSSGDLSVMMDDGGGEPQGGGGAGGPGGEAPSN